MTFHRHLHAADDLTVRWKWEPGSVAFWDNRVVAHRAVPGGYDTAEREGKRTAVYGEKPFLDPINSVSLSQYLAGERASVEAGNSNGHAKGKTVEKDGYAAGSNGH
jgi:sulfonate dioxygenase